MASEHGTIKVTPIMMGIAPSGVDPTTLVLKILSEIDTRPPGWLPLASVQPDMEQAPHLRNASIRLLRDCLDVTVKIDQIFLVTEVARDSALITVPGRWPNVVLSSKIGTSLSDLVEHPCIDTIKSGQIESASLDVSGDRALFRVTAPAIRLAKTSARRIRPSHRASSEVSASGPGNEPRQNGQ